MQIVGRGVELFDLQNVSICDNNHVSEILRIVVKFFKLDKNLTGTPEGYRVRFSVPAYFTGAARAAVNKNY